MTETYVMSTGTQIIYKYKCNEKTEGKKTHSPFKRDKVEKIPNETMTIMLKVWC